LSVKTVEIEQIIPVDPKKAEKTYKPDKEPKIYRGPSKKGPCVACGKTGIKRYMIAADLPEPMFLCDRCYKTIRSELRTALIDILQRRGLIPKKIAEAEVGSYRVRIERKEGERHD